MALTKVIGSGLGAVTQDGAATFNEGSADVDFRVESNSNANMLFVNGGTDKVGINTNSPTGMLTIDSGFLQVDVSGTQGIRVGSTDQIAGGTTNDGAIQSNTSKAIRFYNGGTESMRIRSDGQVTKPLQPAFHVQPASLQSNIAINSNVTVVFDTETYDVGSNFASNTFTAPITGKYLLCFSLYLQAIDTAANYYEASINSSNRDYFPATIDPDFADADFNYFSLTGSSIVDMDANDTAKIVLRQSLGTAQSDINTPSFFSGALIC